MSTVDSNIESLNPRFQPIVRAWFEIVMERVIPLRFPNFKAKITETFRSLERQAEQLASGASQVKVGWHNYGLAIDFAVFDEHGVYIQNGGHPAFESFGQIALGLGAHWGIRVNGRLDAGHIEYHPGFTLEQYQAYLQAGKSATEIFRT